VSRYAQGRGGEGVEQGGVWSYSRPVERQLSSVEDGDGGAGVSGGGVSRSALFVSNNVTRGTATAVTRVATATATGTTFSTTTTALISTARPTPSPSPTAGAAVGTGRSVDRPAASSSRPAASSEAATAGAADGRFARWGGAGRQYQNPS
jgi:hypothetical protein